MKNCQRFWGDIIPKIKNKKVEFYNYFNEGVASWYDFAKEIMNMAKINCEVSPIEPINIQPQPRDRIIACYARLK